MRKIDEIMEDVEKNGIIYNGFYPSEVADSFSIYREKTLVLIDPQSIRFQTREDNNPLKAANTLLFAKQFDLIIELYQYIKETRESIPKKYAKHQKELDDYFKFETGHYR